MGWRHIQLCMCLLSMATAAHSSRADPPDSLSKIEALALVRTALVRLNDANQADSYAMLRKTAAPDFQRRFTEQELATLFAGMRAKDIDLSRVIGLEPAIEVSRYHTGQGVLQLGGVIDSKPMKTRFNFSFQRHDGSWKLYGLGLDFVPAAKSTDVAAPF